MAYLNNLRVDAEHFPADLKRSTIQAQYELRLKYQAAIKIQSLFRGYITRKHIRNLHWQASIIQNYYRKVKQAEERMAIAENAFYEKSVEYYGLKVARIQALWRGRMSRKYLHDYYGMKQQFDYIRNKHEELKRKMQEFRDSEEEAMKRIVQEETMEWLMYVLKKSHYMLRTHVSPGIYSLRDSQELSPIETLIIAASKNNIQKLDPEIVDKMISRLEVSLRTFVETAWKCK